MNTIKHKDHFHGSDLETIEKIYGIKKEDIISFSANVNPLGISPMMEDALRENLRCIERYPDREYSALRRSIAEYAHCDPEQILVGNGSTELISHVIADVMPKKALILGPSYSEYEHSVSLAGGASVYFPLRERDGFSLPIDALTEKLTDDMDLLVICNPNNPTGTLIENADMRKILDCCMEHAIFVMIDETYMEFTADPRVSSAISLTGDYNNLVVLRGVSKFFAAPGLRLGYAVTGSRRLLAEVSSHSDPWTVSAFAELAGTVMFSDTDYMEKTRELIDTERKRMYALFQESKRFKPFRPSANFMLMRIEEDGLTSNALFDRCIREGMMIRDCSTFPFLDDRFIRFCFLMPEQNDRLAGMLLD